MSRRELPSEILLLHELFSSAANPGKALQMSAYLKNRFPFFGISSPDRKALIKPFLQDIKSSEIAFDLVKYLFELPEREFHYTAVDALFISRKRFKADSVLLIEQLIQTNSWWDTVDALATHSAGYFFLLFPSSKSSIPLQWIDSPNMWLRRSAILFQLKYKNATDTDLLAQLITRCREENDFFIRKAIGWALRQYARTDPQWVLDFVHNTPLKPLSTREALKHFGH